MGVYIPNIKIPEKCSKCRNTGLMFAIDELGLKCPERKEIFGPTEADIKGIRRPDCPLVHVPPHGRLGDLDKLADNMRSATAGMEHRAIIMHEIRRAPTVIEAEEGNGNVE